jgi:hypothetical protein
VVFFVPCRLPLISSPVILLSLGLVRGQDYSRDPAAKFSIESISLLQYKPYIRFLFRLEENGRETRRR